MDRPASGPGRYWTPDIAQADRGATATVSVYQVAAPLPPDERLLPGRPGSWQRCRLTPSETCPPPGLTHAAGRYNPLFTGRVHELRWLASHLGDSTKQTPTVVVAGLGGVGKSQLASEYAHRNGRYYAGGVYWVSLANPTASDNEVAACGGPEGMQLRPDFSTLSIDDQIRLVRAAWQSPIPRLLIFDNCEDESLLAHWRPPSGGCRILVTSRRTRWAAALGVEISELKKERATENRRHCIA